MASELAERFMNALQEAEDTGDVSTLEVLFTDDAELYSLASTEPRHGVAGAHDFWLEYLRAFDCVRSRFIRVTESGDVIVLEWISDGVLPDGTEVTYRGVSVLETADSLVRRFRSYYDSAALKVRAVTAGRSAGWDGGMMQGG
jgi:ketosteroid isomerase-like protein